MFCRTALVLVVMVGLGGLPGVTQGAFILVEDFNELTTGPIDGQNGWTGTSSTVDVIDTAPASVTDKALQNGDTSQTAYKTIPTIANGDTGTLFFQFNASTLASGQSMGLADTNLDGNVFDNYRPQMALNGAGDFTVRDGNTSRTLDFSSDLQADTWYSVWMVVDNASNTWQAYIEGGVAQTQMLLVSGTQDTFAFRDNESGSADLTNFLFARGGGGEGNSVVIDNIWVDNTGVNLSNPIPEPGSLALLGLGGWLILVRKR